MFKVRETRFGRGYQGMVLGLIVLSLAALGVGAWILWDFGREQEIVAELLDRVPAGVKDETRKLAGELRLQARLLVLVLLNAVATVVAMTLLLRTLRSSQRSLRQVTELANDILESMDEGVLTTDRSGKITSINRRGHALLGLDGDAQQWHLDDLDGQHGPLAEMNRQVLQTRQVIRDHDYAVTTGGYKRSLRGGCSLLLDSDGAEMGTVIHLRDVTERLLLEERMRRMERHMGLGSLATGLHHEIKNPLSALWLHVQLLEEYLTEHSTTDEIDETIDVLKSEVGRINRVLETFRDYAALSVLERSPTEVIELVESLRRLLMPQAERQGVELRVVEPPTPLPPIQADAVKLQQVLLNLCLNGLQAMPQGGVLSIETRVAGETLQIDVVDSGVGIHEEIYEQIFDPYFTTRGDGTGMGLALSEKIVRLHGGTLTFRCDPARTVFTVALPIETC